MKVSTISIFKPLTSTPILNLITTVFRHILYNGLVILICHFAMTSCQSKTSTFESFDSQSWKNAPLACNGYRNSVINEMEAEFDKFLGMNEKEILDILGAPTKTLLYTRGQKFFSYELDCYSKGQDSKSLRIRFSALDVVNEVLILE